MNEQTSEKLKKLALKNAEQRVADAQVALAEIEELLKMVRNQRQEALTRLTSANAELAKLQGLIGDLV